MNDRIRQLLLSNIKEDILIAANILKNATWEEVAEYGEPHYHPYKFLIVSKHGEWGFNDIFFIELDNFYIICSGSTFITPKSNELCVIRAGWFNDPSYKVEI